MQQSELPGFGSAMPPTTHNIFFALVPDAQTRASMAEAVERIRRDLRPAGRWIRADRFHLTLHYLGTFPTSPQTLIETAVVAADTLRAQAFDLVLDRLGSFRNRSIPWWLGASATPPELTALHETLAKALLGAGIKVEIGKPFAAHVTILRDAAKMLAPTPIAPIRWRVEEFVLIDSVLGPRAEHVVRGRWPLGETS